MTQLRHLIREIHRRSLWQVLAIYLVGAWLAYEVILALFEGLGLPEWVPALAIVLFIVGLPIVLATAFVQEGLPGEPSDASSSSADAATSPTGDDGGAVADPTATRGPVPAAGEAGSGTEPGPRPGRRWLLTWPRAITAGVLAFALLGLAATGFLGMRALGVGPFGTLVAKGELEAREPLVVADFRPLTGDTSLAAVVTEGLRADLTQSSFVTVVDRSQVRATLERMLRDPDAGLDPETAREVALRLGLKAVVEGEVGRAGAGYLLTARVVTADSGRTLTTVRETAADSTEILAAIESVSRGLRERVGESLKAVRASAPLAQVTTSSLPALRKAVEGYREERAGNRPRAMRLMNEAIELDPGFAWAWQGLAIMHYNNNDQARALHAIDRALEHRDRLSDLYRYRVRSIRASVVGDLAAARREHEDWIARDTTDWRPYIAASDVAWNQGDWDAAARHAERAIQLGAQDNWVAHWNRIIALVDDGRFAEARAATALADSLLGPEHDSNIAAFRTMVLSNEARYDSVYRLLQAEDMHWRAATVARLLGRWTEMRRHLEETDPGSGDDIDALEHWDRLLVLGDAAAGDAIVAYFDRTSATTDTVSGSFDAQLAVGLAMAGRVDAARRVRDHYRAGVPEAVRWRDDHLLRAVEGFIALHEGRVDAGLAALRAARESTPWTALPEALLGRAYDAMGRADSAVAAYTRFVETPWALRSVPSLLGDVVLRVPAHIRLALLLEEAGDLEAAARHAATVVELWDNADPAVQGRVDAMRRILQRAAGEV